MAQDSQTCSILSADEFYQLSKIASSLHDRQKIIAALLSSTKCQSVKGPKLSRVDSLERTGNSLRLMGKTIKDMRESFFSPAPPDFQTAVIKANLGNELPSMASTFRSKSASRLRTPLN
mmetsp:Transcript_114750/g.180686  ORF Transcript_114750/g.180686 Transcript_114750/m.180686 type:complete len:119 (+) Transcript_114750:22-378(+)